LIVKKDILTIKFKYEIKKKLIMLAIKQIIWFFKYKGVGMKNKTFLKDCKCIHCQQKLEQINSSRLYWDKLILRKKLA